MQQGALIEQHAQPSNAPVESTAETLQKCQGVTQFFRYSRNFLASSETLRKVAS